MPFIFHSGRERESGRAYQDPEGGTSGAGYRTGAMATCASGQDIDRKLALISSRTTWDRERHEWTPEPQSKWLNDPMTWALASATRGLHPFKSHGALDELFAIQASQNSRMSPERVVCREANNCLGR